MRKSHVEARLEQQVALSRSIANSYDELVKSGLPNITATRIQLRSASLKEEWERFSLINDAIRIAIRELSYEDQLQVQQHPYLQEDLFSSTKDSYLNSLEKITALLEHETTISDNSTSAQMALQVSATAPFSYHSRLPRIDLPKFNGSQSEWLSFKDLFNSLVIANPTLSAVEKLQYLKTSITGSAAHLLSNTALTAENFQKAWEALIAFYENKRLLVNAALHSLFALKRMNGEYAAEMEQLYTKMTQIYRTLESLGRPVAFWDDFLIFVITRKLDSESVKAWEQQLGASKEPPKWHQFSEFMVTRFLTLQAYERARSGKAALTQHPKAAKVHHHSNSKGTKSEKVHKCGICTGQHYTASCAQYQLKPVKRKLELIQKHKLCYNCLGNHRSSLCRVTKRCQRCGRKHHTSIHQTSSQTSKSKSEETTNVNSTASSSKTVPAATHSTTS